MPTNTRPNYPDTINFVEGLEGWYAVEGAKSQHYFVRGATACGHGWNPGSRRRHSVKRCGNCEILTGARTVIGAVRP